MRMSIPTTSSMLWLDNIQFVEKGNSEYFFSGIVSIFEK